jgi:catechol 2,3-dioxygenase-like lactoylglutathione lyase family enzyme
MTQPTRDPAIVYTAAMAEKRGTLDHVTVGVSDLERSRAFYEAALTPLGLDRAVAPEALPGQVLFGNEHREWAFVISTTYQTGAPVHVAFGAGSVEQVQAFHAAALAAGGTDNGAPGPRPQYSERYYGAFVLDPDGHNIEAVTRV